VKLTTSSSISVMDVNELPNIQMEPTRLTVRAVISLRRAAHLNR